MSGQRHSEFKSSALPTKERFAYFLYSPKNVITKSTKFRHKLNVEDNYGWEDLKHKILVLSS